MMDKENVLGVMEKLMPAAKTVVSVSDIPRERKRYGKISIGYANESGVKAISLETEKDEEHRNNGASHDLAAILCVHGAEGSDD
jgi:hypothetical protein